MARIPFPDPEELPEQTRAAIGKMAAPLNLIRMTAHAPMLVKPVLMLSTTLLTRTELGPRERELLILRTASNSRCEYVLAQHRVLAAGLGLAEREIEAACAEPVVEGVFGAVDTALLRAADQLDQGADVDAGLVAFLDGELGHARLVEAFVIVGQYRMLAGLLNGLDVDIDPSGEKFVALAQQTAPTGKAGDE
ncbi:carboxymuconolactone decarboxylase family protein [Streptomyces sp. HNM0575]|uniref:carboxymuconolactone decarboxylase family protein n=1 Tax=Streptomyces sp. HNM0575 TaxID=2716338 RepID=UPI00145EBE19|nr:carboxymuconolactone decarboxylase family protein [Streptomyces sp. HNM0575]NLU76582.1 carboxymuconolactone decarboxylase family protein [Streptomyces sp. HNM0575]